MQLAGRVALVTGASSKTSRAIAGRLVSEGMKVCLVDLDEAAARAAAEPLGALALACDLSDPEQVDAVFDECARQLDGLDLVYLGAGAALVWADDDVESTEPADRHGLVGLDADGLINGERAAVRTMRAYEGDGGVIIAAASFAGAVSFAPDSINNIGQHGAIDHIRSIAPDLAAEGIAAHAVCHGNVAGRLDENDRPVTGVIGEPAEATDHVAEALVVAATAPLALAGTCWVVPADAAWFETMGPGGLS